MSQQLSLHFSYKPLTHVIPPISEGKTCLYDNCPVKKAVALDKNMPSNLKILFDLEGTNKEINRLMNVRKFQKLQMDIATKNMKQLENNYKQLCAENKVAKEKLEKFTAECKGTKIQRRALQQQLKDLYHEEDQMNPEGEEMSVDSGLEKTKSDVNSFFDQPINDLDYDIFGENAGPSEGAGGNQCPDIFAEIGSTNTGHTPSEPSVSQGGRGRKVEKTPSVDDNPFLSQRSSTPRGFLGGAQKIIRGKKR